MPVRPFLGVQSIAATANAQPVFGVATSAASVLIPDPYTGNTNPGSNYSLSKLTATNIGFKVGDSVLVGPAAGPFESGTISSLVSTTGMVVTGLMKVHASGEFIILNEAALAVRIVPVTVTAAMYIGTDSTTGATSASTVDVLILPATIEPRPYIDMTGSSGHPFSTGQYWIQSTIADKFIASFNQG